MRSDFWLIVYLWKATKRRVKCQIIAVRAQNPYTCLNGLFSFVGCQSVHAILRHFKSECFLPLHLILLIIIICVWLCFPQASALPMSIIIVGVGPAEFDGKFAVCVCVVCPSVIARLITSLPYALRYTMLCTVSGVTACIKSPFWISTTKLCCMAWSAVHHANSVSE